MPIRNFVVATATLVTVIFCFHSCVLSCFTLNETFDMLQQQETLYFEYANLGLHIEFQIIKSTNSFRHVYVLILLHQFLLGMESISGVPFAITQVLC